MAEKKETASTFPVADLLAVAKSRFGVKPEIMAGALHGVTTEITLADAKAKLEVFLKRPVQNVKE